MKFLTVMNIAGEIFRVYKTANTLEGAERLARIEVARQKGLIPSPWAVDPSDIITREIADHGFSN